MDMITAVEKVDESLGLGASAPETATPAAAPVPTPVDNDRALAELQAMMAGLQR